MAKTKSIREQKEEARRKARRDARQAAGGSGGKKPSLTSIVIRSAGIALIGTFVAVVLFRAAISLGAAIDPDLQTLVVMLGFIVLFLTSMLTRIGAILPEGKIKTGGDGAATSEGSFTAPAQKFGGALEPRASKFDKVFDDANVRLAAEPITLDEQDGFASESGGSNGTALNSNAEENNGADMGVGPGGAGPQSNSETEENAKQPEDDDALADQAMAKVLVHLKAMIADVTETLKTRGKSVDNFAKFGLNLYFAGACSNLTKTFSLSAKEGQAVLSRLMELTGANKETARAFSDRVNEYGEQSQYRTMIDAGDAAMARILDEESEAGSDLSEVLDQWCNPDNSVELPSIHTFMFTDIVDSTALTEELGNQTMQKVIRAHNKIVRDALGQFGGDEVKHTGDGIMATFSNPRFAIEACIQMQQEIDLFNRKKPQLSFDIRIGLHTGEAVLEEDDYYGTAVQTAARICAEAGSSEIWISDEIWRAVPRYADDCKYCGEFALKGLSGQKVLYTVMWDPLPDKTAGKVDYQELGAR